MSVEHAALVEHYARLLRASESARDAYVEGARRGEHWFHTKVRRSTHHVFARRQVEALDRLIPDVLAEAVERGVTEAELRRWGLVLRFEAGEIKPPPTLHETIVDRL